eukprot:6194464-Pleurochrysis_carterae.AAC.2
MVVTPLVESEANGCTKRVISVRPSGARISVSSASGALPPLGNGTRADHTATAPPSGGGLKAMAMSAACSEVEAPCARGESGWRLALTKSALPSMRTSATQS